MPRILTTIHTLTQALRQGYSLSYKSLHIHYTIDIPNSTYIHTYMIHSIDTPSPKCTHIYIMLRILPCIHSQTYIMSWILPTINTLTDILC